MIKLKQILFETPDIIKLPNGVDKISFGNNDTFPCHYNIKNNKVYIGEEKAEHSIKNANFYDIIYFRIFLSVKIISFWKKEITKDIFYNIIESLKKKRKLNYYNGNIYNKVIIENENDWKLNVWAYKKYTPILMSNELFIPISKFNGSLYINDYLSKKLTTNIKYGINGQRKNGDYYGD